MSIVFAKKKEKRPRTSSSEANTSFVKHVTSKVSGLLPSTITKWFSSPSSSNTNGSAPMAEATDSSTEDEAPETQPPAKRMRYNTPGKYNHYGITEATTSNVEITEIPYSPFSSTQYPQRGTIISSPIKSTNEEPSKEKPENDNSVYKTQLQHTVAGIGQSIANRRKSIFETANKKEDTIAACKKSSLNTVKDPKQPYFKPTLLGSPFYPGNTMYGGASSSYINEPNIRQQTVALVNESTRNEDSALSSSARRIMDLLESYSSPLMEARRIPHYTKPRNDSLNMSSDQTYPYRNRSISHRTQELYVPSFASILRLKKKSRLMDTTKAARQIIASHSSASNYPTYPTAPEPGKDSGKEQSTKMTTKIKSKLTRTNRGTPDEVDIATPVKLPAVGLNIDKNKLPTFDTPVVTKLIHVSSTPKALMPTDNKKNTDVSISKPETVTSSVFKFSNPVKISSDAASECDTTPPKFVFESPEQRIDQKFYETPIVICSVKDINKKATTSSTQPDWKCPDCWVSNKSESEKCLCCGAKKPAAVLKCVVCKVNNSKSQKDKCEECSNNEVSQAAASSTAKLTVLVPSSKWKCEDCWVSNESNVDKCACCGSSKTKSNAAPAPSKISPDVSHTGADWKCDDCWVSNKSAAGKCVACGGAKPGAKQSTLAQVSATSTNLFGTSDDRLKSQQTSPKWDCKNCLVKNDIVEKACVCCGTKQSKDIEEPDVKFNFGKNLPSFKFGIDPKLQEATIAKTPEMPSVSMKAKEELEKNNNVLAETPKFTFGLPAKHEETKIPDIGPSTDEVPKVTFTFGMPKQTSVDKVDMPKPSEATSTQVVEEENPQEVPSVNLSAPIEKKAEIPGKVFVSPITQFTSDNKIVAPVPTLTSTFKEIKNDTPSDPIKITLPVLNTVSSAEKPQSNSTFTFGVKSNAFSAPATTSPSNLFATPASSSIATTNAPTMSLFKPLESSNPTALLFSKPETAPASTVSLFQTPESNAMATPSPAAPAPLFSFGTNSSTPAPASTAPTPLAAATEKPKFQFTFGNTSAPKTEITPLFKPTFGAGTENRTFSLPTGNSLNTLGGSNGMPVTNGLAGNGMPSNGLSGNTLCSGQQGNSLIANNLNSMTPSMPLGGGNGLATSSLTGNNGNTLGGSTGLFGNTIQKENMWSTNSSNNTPSPNMFVSNTNTNSLQKPAAFTFGSSTPFNASNSTPAFGNNATPAPNPFGIASPNNNNQPSMFSNPVQNQPPANIFGSPQATNNSNNPLMFGAGNIGATPTFGTPNASIPSFEAQQHAPAPAPAFNFGASASTGIFGFGQQAQSPQAPQATQSVYSFGGGAPAPAGPQVQFSIGSGANTAARRVRKAVRRNMPR